MITLLLSLVVLLGILRLASKDRSFAAKIPSPGCLPLIGSSHLFIGKDQRQTFTMICGHFARFPTYFKYQLGARKLLCLSDPDLVQQALTTGACQNKAFFYKFFDVNYGLISASYSDWKLYRKMLNPAFNQKILVGFVPIFDECSKTMVDSMQQQEHGSEFDVIRYTSRCTLDMICKSSLGSDIAAEPSTMLFCSYLEDLLHLLAQRWFKPVMHVEWIYRLSATFLKEQKLRKKMEEIFEPIIEQKRNQMKQKQGNTNLDDKEFDRKPLIFVDQLLRMEKDGQELTLTEIQSHIYTIIAAGNETSALQTSFVLLMLAMHQDVQHKVLAEIELIYPGTLLLSYDSLRRQNYLELVIDETMRLFPVAPIVGRETIQPVQLEDLAVPAGVTLLMNFFNLHRRRDLWGPDADRFDPERFREENSRGRHPSCYFPFAGGPRNCIGYRYGMLVMKAMVTHVIGRYRLATRLRLNELQLSHEITLRLPGGHLMTVESRQG